MDLVLGVMEFRLQKADVHISTDFSQLKFDFHAVEQPLAQIVMNLISNSLHAVSELENRWIRVEAVTNHSCGILRVIDSGSGLSDKVAEEVMQPFFTTKKAGEGTGLGLSLSLNFCRKMGGDLRYRTLNGNTCFEIQLPLSEFERKQLQSA